MMDNQDHIKAFHAQMFAADCMREREEQMKVQQKKAEEHYEMELLQMKETDEREEKEMKEKKTKGNWVRQLLNS